ncbi:hypothetical protein TNIN_348921 [Trichonephila inaurata madagascariensis]|uniref:Uncharacterized protein n=1 Tax=Trichonephila inaurata madagascariensis TaxID=2747483 RepID=A0A8X6Y843_9ARAC|nr:hypothetical protein TNIN_348921 [Trichonephila inaurata madagascariensis]
MFAAGQAYVTLSSVKSLDGLLLIEELDYAKLTGKVPCNNEALHKLCFPYYREDEWFLPFKLFNCLGLRIIGKGFSSGKKLCAFLGLPLLSKLTFRNQERKKLKVTERVAQ